MKNNISLAFTKDMGCNDHGAKRPWDKMTCYQNRLCPSKNMTLSQTKCVLLTTPLNWGSCINLHHVSKVTRGMHWGTATKRYFKRFIDLFFTIPDAHTNVKLVKDFHFSTSILHNYSNLRLHF